MNNCESQMIKRWCNKFTISLAIGFVLTGMIIGYLLVEAKTWATRFACAWNMGSISGCISYSSDRPGVEARLSTLLAGMRSSKTLICPATTPGDMASSPAAATSWEPDEVLTHSSYVYIPCGSDDSCPGDICRVFELPINHRQEGANFAAANGSVSWLNNDAFLARVQNLNDYFLGRRDGK